ncbi:MAG: hypothetical protein NTV93_00400 [Verrucomicrobia bacterium]|nr:hypothetical protein [Verrucomicrobiota bacterium]
MEFFDCPLNKGQKLPFVELVVQFSRARLQAGDRATLNRMTSTTKCWTRRDSTRRARAIRQAATPGRT